MNSTIKILYIFCALFTCANFILSAQDDAPKTAKHILWINIPELSKEGLENSPSRNLQFTANKGYSNYNLQSEKEDIKALLFSCDGENIIQALENYNPNLKTAAYVADKALYKKLSGLGIDDLKNGKSDVELTEWAYDYLRSEKPNFMFINFSGIKEVFNRGNKADSEAYKKAVSQIDVMISGIFKGLIESRLYGSMAIIISTNSSDGNGFLLIQADGIVDTEQSEKTIYPKNIMSTINQLIGDIPQFKCSEASVF